MLNWLQNCYINIVKEEEQGGQNEELPVDIKQLLQFVGDSSKLYLEDLGNSLRPMKGTLQEKIQQVQSLWAQGLMSATQGLSQYFMLEHYVVDHYVPEQKKKRKRRNWSEESDEHAKARRQRFH